MNRGAASDQFTIATFSTGRLGKIAMNYFEADKAGYDSLAALTGTIAAITVM